MSEIVYQWYEGHAEYRMGADGRLAHRGPNADGFSVGRHGHGACAAELARLAEENKRLAAFVAAYDAWAESDEMLGGDLFDSMVEARTALDAKERRKKC